MSSPSVRDVLIAARKLIEKPENWTQRAWARDADGTVINSKNGDAVCWCSEGAIRKFSSDYFTRRSAEMALVKAFDGMAYETPAKFNDSLSHSAVLAAFDKAIAECGQ